MSEPLNEDELSSLVKEAVTTGTPLEVRGGGTKRAIGRPVEAKQGMTTRGLAGIVDYDPTELVITALAGTPVHEVQAALAPRSQQFAFEPRDLRALLGANGDETLGGLVCANLSGPRRFAAGGVRDHLLGFRAVSGRGEIFKSGGRVVKNVTGYDLSKLVVGSFGTLAILSEVTLRVTPRPAETGTLIVSGREIDRFAATLDVASGAGALTGGAYLTAGARVDFPHLAGTRQATIAVRFEGDTAIAAANAARKRLGPADTDVLETDASTELWAAIRDLAPLLGSDGNIWRVSLRRTAIAAFVESLDLPEGAPLMVDWVGGQIWFAEPQGIDVRARLHAAAGPDGHATVIRAADHRPTETSVFHPQSPAVAALSRRIKHHFDPKGILNPGRLYADY